MHKIVNGQRVELCNEIIREEVEADPDYQAHLADPTVGYPKSE